MTRKLVIFVSHPIQHFVPFYRALAQEDDLDVTVVFAARIGVDPYFDKAMNTTISWKMDLLGGYDHVFLPEADQITSTSPRNVNNPSIAKELERLNPDVVLLYGYNYITSLRALWWCRRNSVPTMMISDSELKTQRSKRTNFIKKLTVPLILRQFSAFLTVGDCNEDYLAHYGASRADFFRSPFTIDEDTYQAAFNNRAELRHTLRAELGLSETDVVALTVGKLSRRKRPADIIEAARLHKSQGLATKFVIVGNGEEMDRLTAVVDAENLPVIMAGFINVDVLPSYYAAADLIVHPSSRDPHPLVTCEGSAMGLPLVLSSRVGAAGPTDSARPGENATIFEVGDIAELSDAVAQIVADPEKRAQMGRRSREIFDELDTTRSVNGLKAAVAHSLRSTGNE